MTRPLTPESGHMHNGSLRYVDENHLISSWQFYENGHLKSTESAQYTRVRNAS